MSFVSFVLHAREAPDRRDRRAHGGRETDPKYVRTPASPRPEATRTLTFDRRTPCPSARDHLVSVRVLARRRASSHRPIGVRFSRLGREGRPPRSRRYVAR